MINAASDCDRWAGDAGLVLRSLPKAPQNPRRKRGGECDGVRKQRRHRLAIGRLPENQRNRGDKRAQCDPDRKESKHTTGFE